MAFDAFQSEVGPLVAQSCDSTSNSEDGFLMAKACRDEVDEDDGI